MAEARSNAGLRPSSQSMSLERIAVRQGHCSLRAELPRIQRAAGPTLGHVWTAPWQELSDDDP
jgi:hypothetical protein